MLPFYVIGAALLGACLLNSLSDDERERQQRLEENYREYKNSSDEEQRRILRERDETLKRMQSQTAHELWLERQRALAERKERNRKNFNVLMEEWRGQVDDRKNLLEQVDKTIDTLKKTKEQATELRQTSLQVILSEAYEARARQKAYVRYLERYKKAAEKIFERAGNLLEPFSMTLPGFWAYPGKIIGFEREELLCGEFEKNIHQNVDCKFFCTDSNQIDRLFPDTEIIYCLVEDYDNKTYTNKISCVKGMFIRKLEQNPNVQLAATVKRHELNEQGEPAIYILEVDGLEATLRKKDCRDRRNAPVGSRKFIYVRKFDRKEWKWINVTERIEDCLSVERFRGIPLSIKNCDVKDFLTTAQKRNALENYDEWYMAPISDGENFSRTKYKCQLGQKLIFLASFTEEESPKLIFERFLPDEEMIAANDIFVALDAELDATVAEQSNTISPARLAESQNLLIYLSAEFLKQQRIKANQENVLFLNQWCAVMRRLIRAKESGGFCTVEILEKVDAKKYLTSKDNAAALKKFYEWQLRKQDAEPNFFIRDAGDKKISVTFEENFKIIKTAEILEDDFLERVGYSFDVNVREFPYPEIMQSTALENFRCSFMQTPALKECILDLSHMPFKDSGRRPKTIKNSSLLKNKKQMLAVVRSVVVENFFMIQGPPGTGKTTVIKEIIWQQLRLEPASKILVVSQANVAVDNVLRGLPSMGIARSKIVRCGNDDKISDELKDFSLDKQVELYREKLSETCRADLEPYRKIWRDMMSNTETQGLVGEYLLKNFSVTGATCVGLAKKHFGLDRLSFDLVIADEAGKALPGELLLPINRAKKIIIIGDHKQLPPVIDPAFFDESKVNIKDIVDEENQDKFFATSLFEKLYETCPADNKCMLDIQFRMPTKIGEMVSDLFYERQLNCAPPCAEKSALFFGNNIFFLNMDNDPAYHEKQDVTKKGEKSGPYNDSEILVAAALLRKLRENFSGRIAVITPYKNQNKKLRQRLRGEHLKNIVVNTIDAFQGDEADIVIYCTTRAKLPTNYFSDAARLNVAFSRARNLLIIIGALKYFRKYKSGHLMQRVADYLENRGRIVNGVEFFSADFQSEYHEPPSAKKILDNLTETPLTPREVESFLPVQDEENFLQNCRGCNQKFKAAELVEGFCSDCLFDGEHYKCQNCGADMLYTNAAKYIHNQPKEELCAACKIIWRHICKRCGVNEVIVRARDLRNNPSKTEKDFSYCRECLKARNEKISRRCAACGQEFFVTQGQQENLRAQGKAPSAYCKDCWSQEVSAGTCKRCGRQIKFKRAKLHELRSQGKKISDYCPDCFEERNEKIPVTCEICDNAYLEKRGYIEDLHTKGKAFYCDDCREENVALPYTCKVCGETIYISRVEIHKLREKFGSNYSPPRTHKHCR